MRNRFAFAFALSTLFITQVSRADRPWLVGELGDFSRIEFHGNASFPDDKIVSALDSDFALLSASRPLASLATLLRTIETELQHGYRHLGFPEAMVTADYDESAQGVIVEIVEGPQFHNGPVVVTGVAGELEQLLIERLTEDEKPAAPMLPNASQPPAAGVQTNANQKRQALWVNEVPTSFTEFQGNELVKRILETMNEAGYLEAHVDIDLAPDAASGLTQLVVSIKQGPATSVGRIEIVGIERHSQSEIEDYLDIEVGMPCDLFSRRQWESRLEESGRFALHTITTSAIDSRPGEQLVQIALYECEDVPTLSEELSEIDLALLRTAEWLAHPENFDGDICVHFQGDLNKLCGAVSTTLDQSDDDEWALPAWLDGADVRFDLALSPNGASFLGMQVVSSTGVPLFGYAFEFSSTAPSIYSSATTNTLRFENDGGPQPNVNITFYRAPTDDAGRKFGLNFGMGVSSESGGLLQIRVTPAFMLSNAHSRDATFEVRDGVLYVDGDVVRLQFDAATGRLILCECTSENGDSISITIRQNGVPTTISAYLGQAPTTQLNHGQSPAIALGEFLAAETAWWAHRLGNETESTRWEALSRLLRNYDATSDVETVAFITSDADDDEERFHIPASQALAANPLSWVGQCVLMGNTALLSRGSPAWQVGREAVAAMILGDATAFAELERLSRDETCGPLTSLYAAELLRFVHPALEKAWADRGLRRLDAVSLSNDLNQLTTDTPLGDFLAELVRELDRLPEAELQAVFAGIGDEWVSHAITIVTESSVRPETRVQQLVQLFWMAGLKDRVQDRLADHLRSGMETTLR